MKDLTQEWREALKTEDTHRKYVLFGEKNEIPKNVFDTMLNNYKFLEMKNINEVIENYPDLIKKIRIPFQLMFWLIGLMGKIAKKIKYFEDFTKFDQQYGNLQRELYGNDYRMMDIITRKINFPAQLILTDIKIEKLRQIKNDLFSAYQFDLVDIHGTRIEGIFVYDEYFQQIFSSSEDSVINKRSTIEMVRTADPATTWIIYAMALTEVYTTREFKNKERGKRLLVRHIQESGSRVKPDMPFLMVR